MFKSRIEYVKKKDLVTLFSHYQKYIEGCGMKFDVTLLEDFDAINYGDQGG